MNQEFIKVAENKMKQALDHLGEEMGGVRSGRANPGLVDSMKINVYGQEMPLKTIATISTPDAKTIQIQPWDASNMSAIEKAITDNQTLGLSPSNDGRVIRLNVPPMSEETRAQMVKLVHQKAEESTISLRNARHEALNDGKAAEKDKKITQDDLASLEKKLNDLIDGYNTQIEQMSKAKETELMQA